MLYFFVLCHLDITIFVVNVYVFNNCNMIEI